MSLTRAIASNTAIQVTGKFIGTLLGILTVAVATRYLGLAAYGEFTTVTTFLQFFGILVDFGLTLTMIRLISEPNADEVKVASNVFTLRLVSAVTFYGLAAAIAWLFPYPTQIKVGIAIASLSYLGISLSQTLVGVFQKKLAVAKASIAEVAGRTALFVGVLAAAEYDAGFLAVVAMLVLANAIQFALNWTFVRQLLPIRLACDRELWRRIIRESWPIGVSIAFNLVYLKSDVLILSVVRTQSEVGLYGAAYKILDVITVVPTVFMGVVMPVLAASWAAQNRAEFGRRLGRAFEFLSLLAIPLVFGTLPVARDLMALLGGPAFAAAGPLLVVLMGAGAMVFWSALFGHAIVAIGLQRNAIWGYAVDAVLSLGLYFVLIPRYGAIGAAWVTFFSEAFIAIVTAGIIMRRTGARPPLQAIAKSFVAAVVMCAALYVIASVPVLLRVVIGIGVYFGVLFSIGGVNRDTLALILRQPAPAAPKQD